MTEPTQTTIAVKGNRMVHKSKLTTSITDLDKETITTIDNEKKTYTVMTFAQMKEQMEELTQRMKQRGGSTPAAQPPAQQGERRRICSSTSRWTTPVIRNPSTGKKRMK